MKRITALADCNNFFVSCEILRNPSLKGQPVCVLSNCDGCVVSRSNEAKELGISMGIPLFMAKKQFPQAIYLSGDLKYYHQISKRVQAVLKDFSPKMEVYSIDEAFLDVTYLHKVYGTDGYSELAKMFHNILLEQTGIPVSIGIANSKILCKIAADRAKHGNSYYFIPFENIENEICDYKIENIWGIGRNTASLLKSHGIYTAGDILNKDKEFFKHFLGKRGLELKFSLQGEDVMPVNGEFVKPKSIQKTSSFKTFTNDKNFLKDSILEHLHNACRKMRKYNLSTTEITVMLRSKDFRILSATETIENPTNAEYLLNKKAVELFNQIYSPNILYRSSGVYAGGFKDEDAKQLLLFNDTVKFEKISKIWDKIEERHGRGVFSVGDCRNLINLTATQP
ncbi:MAG: hypothetical protein ACI37T_04840 [Candidatus Gastranaerophilaceae bacterium]